MKAISALILLLAAPLAGAHQTMMNDQPWKACEAHQVADVCEYTNAHEDVYRGTCRDISDALMCVRNKPIEQHQVDEHQVDEQQVDKQQVKAQQVDEHSEGKEQATKVEL